MGRLEGAVAVFFLIILGMVFILNPGFFSSAFRSAADIIDRPVTVPLIDRYVPPEQPNITLAELELRVHSLVNEQRIRLGLSELDWNPRLTGIARSHSSDMAERDYFAHESPEGETFSDRYEEAEFECRIETKREAGRIFYATGAENLYQGHLAKLVYTDGRVAEYHTMEELATKAVQGWMNSTGHRENIVQPFWNEEGIGVVVAEDGKVYATQNFC